MRAETGTAAGAVPPAPSQAQPLLRLAGLGKRFGSLQALQDASLEILPGEIHCLLGENGAGKSTLCNLVFGVHAPDTGEMALAGLGLQLFWTVALVAIGRAWLGGVMRRLEMQGG